MEGSLEGVGGIEGFGSCEGLMDREDVRIRDGLGGGMGVKVGEGEGLTLGPEVRDYWEDLRDEDGVAKEVVLTTGLGLTIGERVG